jgi:hypothetical protein
MAQPAGTATAAADRRALDSDWFPEFIDPLPDVIAAGREGRVDEIVRLR